MVAFFLMEIAACIDHTLLTPDASAEDIRRLCREAVQYGFYGVCVNPARVALARAELWDAKIKICSVIAFPFGATRSIAKSAETQMAIDAGADEIDVVANLGAIKDGAWDVFERDIHIVANAKAGCVLKVIIETGRLTNDQIVHACQFLKDSGADFVKTSTGFLGSGATVEAVRLMRETVGSALGVKASGGIRDRATAEAMLAAGANRLGSSHSVAIVSPAQ
jgi:deoxyribose-phosphate aldolase